jgi:hypothetical protein
MRKEFFRHIIAYTALVFILGGAVILFFAVWPDRPAQRLVAIMLAVSYFLWGIISHTKTSHLTKRVILEYLGVSVLACVLLILMTI